MVNSDFDGPLISFINSFPFTKEAKDYISWMEITPDDLLDDKSIIFQISILER
ncbi:MAG: hypothetical protein ACTSPQ_22630 [Candidatus Helarchaeota archaeon]